MAAALTPSEERVLQHLERHATEVCDWQSLAQAMTGEVQVIDADHNNLRKLIVRLRRKMSDTFPLETVHGFGYRFGSSRRAGS